jgi:2-keto-4-pentenoate hydratase/2-oxohepta-3-ene-1,7-dioic acid hydratase in catechol pathway
MTLWLRFAREGREGFGTLAGDSISVHDGDMFGANVPTGETLVLADVALLTPCVPQKMVCLWNNSRAVGAKNNLAEPAEPLYFLKAPTAYLASGQTIPRPAFYDGRVIYEAELGVVIGKRCSGVDEAAAAAHIFGLTCVNDVTALELLFKDASFPQWTRAKNFDGFGPFGPVIASGLDPAALTVKALLDGRERQSQAADDMFFSPARLVSLISRDLTLLPGDIIACGTTVGALPLKPGAKIEISIAGIGVLSNIMG